MSKVQPLLEIGKVCLLTDFARGQRLKFGVISTDSSGITDLPQDYRTLQLGHCILEFRAAVNNSSTVAGPRGTLAEVVRVVLRELKVAIFENSIVKMRPMRQILRPTKTSRRRTLKSEKMSGRPNFTQYGRNLHCKVSEPRLRV